MTLSDLKPPCTGEWVEYSDDLRTLLLYGGPITEPVEALKRQGWEDFELLSTERALADAAELAEAAERVHLVPELQVDEASAALVDEVGSDRLVALGGGRVIDSAKAVAVGHRRGGGGDPDDALRRADHRLPPAAGGPRVGGRRVSTGPPWCSPMPTR